MQHDSMTNEDLERASRAAFTAHHHSGPTESAYDEPNYGRGGFKTERAMWDAVVRAVIAALPHNAGWQDIGPELVEALGMWRKLVREGGLVRYTVTPGAALNTLVGWTDATLAKARTLLTHEGQE